jgi:hypothetical protein
MSEFSGSEMVWRVIIKLESDLKRSRIELLRRRKLEAITAFCKPINYVSSESRVAFFDFSGVSPATVFIFGLLKNPETGSHRFIRGL